MEAEWITKVKYSFSKSECWFFLIKVNNEFVIALYNFTMYSQPGILLDRALQLACLKKKKMLALLFLLYRREHWSLEAWSDLFWFTCLRSRTESSSFECRFNRLCKSHSCFSSQHLSVQSKTSSYTDLRA